MAWQRWTYKCAAGNSCAGLKDGKDRHDTVHGVDVEPTKCPKGHDVVAWTRNVEHDDRKFGPDQAILDQVTHRCGRLVVRAGVVAWEEVS